LSKSGPLSSEWRANTHGHQGWQFTATSTSKKTHDSFAVTYGSGSVSGTQYTDTVTLSDKLAINSQSIGVASAGKAKGSTGVDGILGVGPVGLTVGTLNPDRAQAKPTVTDNLFSQGSIPVNALGVYSQPATEESSLSGELTFGGADESVSHLRCGAPSSIASRYLALHI
jgi:cathepsin E